MIYPRSWDITPIQLKTKEKTYTGYSETKLENVKVRLQFGYEKITDKDGVDFECNGLFYKNGKINLDKGDQIIFDSNTYVVVRKREFRMPSGKVEYTKVWFE